MTDDHRTMIGFSLDHMRFLEEQIARLDEEIVKKIDASGNVSAGRSKGRHTGKGNR